ncbi:MAG TPA: DUF2145 domain-containing protein [Usitatibacter sp.]|nr:DUF2145 domain-containing protein [Usitatibacter sp.]
MAPIRRLFIGLAIAMATAAPAANAGSNCETRPLDVQTVRQSMDLAERTARRLDASGAQVVILARAGQDLGKYGLSWSHMGFAYREGDTWRVAHKLNHCGTATGALYRQGLGEFFLDRMFRYQSAFVVLSPEAQARVLPVLQDNVQLSRWHVEAYNMVAYPWSLRYQQSNQWVLETLAGAMEPAARTRNQAQGWLQMRDYRPDVLRLSALERLGARVGTAHIAFDDHPDAKRFTGRIETVTVDSAFAWLTRSGIGGTMTRVD